MKKQEIESARVKKEKQHPVIARILSMRDTIEYHLARENRTLDQEFLLILNKQSKLPARHRDFIVEYYKMHAERVAAEEQQKLQEKQNENDQQIQTEDSNDVCHYGNDELHPGE